MILYIAEKPSLGRAIADALPKPHKKAEGCIYVGNGDCVSWCVGHLLEQAEPDAYNPDFKRWSFEHLPIVPQQWQLKPKSTARKQLAVLRKLIKSADHIIHAGDPDREGQLLVDQVIDHLLPSTQAGRHKRDSIERLLVSDLNKAAVTRALAQLKSNKDFIPLSVSALARSRADWLYGLNMTRAYTLQGRKVGYDGVLSVGRVQTPLLGLVVQRDLDIERFQSKPFYQVVAHLQTPQQEPFKALWQPSEACQDWLDEDGRVLSKALAENVVGRITNQPAVVTAYKAKPAKQPPPLPYNLSSLQIDAAKRFRMSAKQVLDVCQSLYEKHKLLTYPRSDCRYLPLEHYQQRHGVLAAIAHNSSDSALSSAAQQADPQLKSKAWNDSKVSAHHALIPTEKQSSGKSLSKDETNIYQLVARQYVAQFYPACQRVDSEITTSIAGGCFIARAMHITDLGWKQLFPSAKKKASSDSGSQPLNTSLPVVEKGQELHCQHGELIEKSTSPPKPFDDASLLAAMTGISRFVQDSELRKILKDTDGLGTEATRAGIIELLFKRDFLQRSGKVISATSAGRALIESLPTVSTTPDMTARWEMQLDAISQKRGNYQSFMQPLETALRNLISDSENHLPVGLKGVKAKKPSYKKKRSGRTKARTNTVKKSVKKAPKKTNA